MRQSPFRGTPFRVGLRILAAMPGPRGKGCLAVAAVLAFLALTVSSAGAARSAGPVLSETILTPATGATVTKKVTWTVQVSGAAATRVEFAVDGKLSSRQSPSSKVTGVRTYGSVLDTRKLKDGPHRLKVTTYGKGLSPVATEATVTVDNVPDATPEPPHQVAIPVIGGDALVGRTLTSSPGEWSGSQPMAFSYLWLRCNPDCAQIDGVDGPSYTVTGDDAGSTLRSRVTATNASGSASESSAPTAVVPGPTPEVAPPHQVSIPVISGDALVGRTLFSSPGEWSGSEPMSFTFRWLRCHADCVQVGEGPSYAVSAEDVGSTIRSRVTATNAAGSASESSAPTAVVPGSEPPAATPPHLVSIPVVSGDALVGRTLTSSTGGWSGTEPMTFTYVWLRCHPDCTVVGDGPSYAVSAEDAGSTIRSRVTATNPAGSASESSAPTAVVTSGV